MSDITNEKCFFSLLVEAEEIANLKVARCKQRRLYVVAGGATAVGIMPFGVHLLRQVDEPKVVPVVAARLHHCLRSIPRQEL